MTVANFVTTPRIAEVLTVADRLTAPERLFVARWLLDSVAGPLAASFAAAVAMPTSIGCGFEPPAPLSRQQALGILSRRFPWPGLGRAKPGSLQALEQTAQNHLFCRVNLAQWCIIFCQDRLAEFALGQHPQVLL